MNADRIIVVEGGEIIEQGSHNDLIVASGRYADLWSKQVFVRPSDEGKAKDDSAIKAGIVNDLSSEQTQNELSKVKPASTTNGALTKEASTTNASTNDPTANDETTERDETIENDEGDSVQQNGYKNDTISASKHMKEVESARTW